ncbi:(2Fe-2S)-binding protein [Neobacillus niacini]|uniref:(2Fe-2S)-binding protein n=1 Tax=Neobacillus niacini TaxID=86668 RepID=UPI0021CB8565|nr:(2Fe-2S)-binding protein [Neobacillus niacini]MCM3768691.1 (2Fe-2S)-binding protein [Neobacillus niacini]
MTKKWNVEVKVNGRVKRAEVEPRLLLVHLLRDEFNLTGTHIGCDTSQCGACTVMMDGKAVKSCTVLAVQADGAEIQTVEGLGTVDQLHPIQAGFWEKHGLQCGFCTPGIMMAVNGLLQDNLNPSEAEIRDALDGVICRCTGYQFIVKAVQQAAETIRNSQQQSQVVPAEGGSV